jgi:hypothetical protein
MEPNNKIIFTIICNDEKYLKQIIDWYNDSYKTDFKIVNRIEDEVCFSEIEVSKYKPSDIFDLGYQFGVKEQKLREEGKIDW